VIGVVVVVVVVVVVEEVMTGKASFNVINKRPEADRSPDDGSDPATVKSSRTWSLETCISER